MNAINIIDRGPNALPIVTVDDKSGSHIAVMGYSLRRQPLHRNDPASPVRVELMLSFVILQQDAKLTTGAANAHAGVAP